MSIVELPTFIAITLGIVVYFIGRRLNRKITVLRNFNIPEPVTGGLIAAAISFALYVGFGVEINFDLEFRDVLLTYFFTAIGLNARISDLVQGGRPLIILLVLTLAFIIVQDAVGIGSAWLLDLPLEVGVLAGSASLIGGHGTAIAWAPDIAAEGVENALEIGIAAATLGLVIASLIGGPMARWLIRRHELKSSETENLVGLSYATEDKESINHLNLMSVILTINLSILIGWFTNQAVLAAGFKLPLFVTCMLAAIVLSNTIPRLLPNLHWPARTRALAVVSDFSLGLFLAMSLMSMQLWTIADLAGPLLFILAAQTAATVFFTLLVLFRAMGGDYQSAVLSAGFGGFALGATPTAIANMTAVSKANGPAPLAFIILPLVAAFFVDVTNAFVIRAALAL
jgi:ESS family glutamate:Na+ symporter